MKRLLCFLYFGFKHDFTPWFQLPSNNMCEMRFRYCQFCGEVEKVWVWITEKPVFPEEPK
jgi:hypothetical protein